MDSILLACGDVDLLRKIAGDLPDGQFKPIATKKGAGIIEKIQNRNIQVAVVHDTLSDCAGADLCQQLVAQISGIQILFLTSGNVNQQGPFAKALRYPVPGPVFRNALKSIAPSADDGPDLEQWRAFYNEIKEKVALLPEQSYWQMLGLKQGAPHHIIVKVFDALSLRYHPDRYNRHRDTKWGAATYELVNELYKTYTEAFAILTDRKLLAKYQTALANGELRLSPEETSGMDTGPKALADYADTSQGKKFLKLAQSDIARQNWSQALQNLNFAASMEPDNAAIQNAIQDVQSKLSS